jgi:hypothetical protein
MRATLRRTLLGLAMLLGSCAHEAGTAAPQIAPVTKRLSFMPTCAAEPEPPPCGVGG